MASLPLSFPLSGVYLVKAVINFENAQFVKQWLVVISSMFSIKFTSSVISSTIFSRSFLPVLASKTTEINMKNVHGSSKYDAKHWSIFLAWLRTICVSESVNFIEKLDQRYNPRRLNLVHNDKFVIVEYYIFNSHWKRKVFISSFLSPHKRFAKTKEHVWHVLENQYIQDVLVRYWYTYVMANVTL